MPLSIVSRLFKRKRAEPEQFASPNPETAAPPQVMPGSPVAQVAALSPHDFPRYLAEFSSEVKASQAGFATAVEEADVRSARTALHQLRNAVVSVGSQGLVLAVDKLREEVHAGVLDASILARFNALSKATLRSVHDYSRSVAVLARYHEADP